MRPTIDLNTVVGVSPDLFVSHLTDQDRRLRRRRRRGSAAAVLLAISAGSAVGYQKWDGAVQRSDADRATLRAHQALLCPQLTELTTPGYDLSMQGGECIGWTVEQPYFDKAPDLAPVVDGIIAENKRVAALSGSESEYVRVGVLMPMTGGSGTAMTELTIKHALQGLYTAQLRANSDGDDRIRDGKPKIQFVLANEGQDESHWRAVERQLVHLAHSGQAHPLVAVTGLAISIPATQAAATQLSQDHIPSVAGVVTATNVVASELFKVSPSNLDHAKELKKYVDANPDLKNGRGFMVYDSNNDNYTATLKSAFTGTFPKFHLHRNSRSFYGKINDKTGIPDRFYSIVQDICTAKSNAIFYAGRDTDLKELIQALGSARCDLPPVTILSAATGLSVLQQDLPLQESMRRHKITVVFASTTAPDRWAKHQAGTPDGYEVFEKVFLHKAHFDPADLNDGYAIMHYDAGLVAASVIQRLSDDLPPGKALTGDLVNNGLLDAHNVGTNIPGASGLISLGATRDNWPDQKSLSIVKLPLPTTPPK